MKTEKNSLLGLEIKVAGHAGYCYGVERALKIAAEAIKSDRKPIFTLGPIIHNPQVVASFISEGVTSIEDINMVDEGMVIIRTHGIDPAIIIKAEARGLEVIDATCPFVAKAQKRAAELMGEGYQVIIIGERDHPEVIGILAYTGGQALVVEEVDDLKGLPLSKKLGVVTQTTQSLRNLTEITSVLIKQANVLKVYNTICHATTQRQTSARKLADMVDVMVVVGGKNSANTTRLAQICRKAGSKTYHLETAAELRAEWFAKAKTVGVTAGASTPEWLLDEVVQAIKLLGEVDYQRSSM
ncbi:MAG TPA: 4-hydroxy-3-methylbut-2-enyl diphosphate reductase [Actinobacteria bacterium]|nr:4-hydroxy-3-methylbut-2-enyl diphosphate reductase [Actinomycetes bacterium]HEX21601.1 4-hydroxy-3-methylbut-2-enyl diphosphate reductase [Actinomycetota bacterium]